MPRPVSTDTNSAPTPAMSRSTGSTGSLIGWPLMRMVPPVSSPSSLRLQREKRAVENDEGDGGEQREDRRLEVERLPEDVAEAERIEPERVDVVRQRRSAAENERRQAARENQTAAAPSRRPRRRPVDRFIASAS